MSEQRKQILNMLAEGKITADEAERLLSALESATDAPSPQEVHVSGGKKPRFLHVKVQGSGDGHRRHENVDIKIPVMLLKAGVKIGSLMPKSAHDKFSSHMHDKGFDLDLKNLDSEHIDELLQALAEMSIDIDADDEKVRIFCE